MGKQGGRLPTVTKRWGWSWLQKAVCLGHRPGANYHLNP